MICRIGDSIWCFSSVSESASPSVYEPMIMASPNQTSATPAAMNANASVMPTCAPAPLNRSTARETYLAAREWFARLSAACAAVDYDAGRRIFADDVASFGTKADIVIGLGPLQRNQWEGIWPNIAGFRVDIDSVRGGGDGDSAWGIAIWTSTGFDEQGQPFERPGRATLTLEQRRTAAAPDGEWLAAHTHFSLNPGTPPQTFGRGGLNDRQ